MYMMALPTHGLFTGQPVPKMQIQQSMAVPRTIGGTQQASASNHY
jgi:hypothetical protein